MDTAYIRLVMPGPSLLLRMTRPGFLSLTAVACVLGFASGGAWSDVRIAHASAAFVLALVMHAAANVLNDYEDARNGADEANTAGIFPFTGGSRLIQQGIVTIEQTRALGLTLLAIGVAGGIVLAWFTGTALLVIGLVGVLLAWSYSAPPLKLMSRSLGELAVGAAWGLVVLGAAYVAHGSISAGAGSVATGFALLAANILLVNEIPDASADAAVGKRTSVVLVGAAGAARVYAALALITQAWLIAAVVLGVAPRGALGGLASAPFAFAACVLVVRHAAQPDRLAPAIKLTIVTALAYGLGVAAGCALD
jgi:1,4-dihydroxy-2-naphthoate polyprenyltransferase